MNVIDNEETLWIITIATIYHNNSNVQFNKKILLRERNPLIPFPTIYGVHKVMACWDAKLGFLFFML